MKRVGAAVAAGLILVLSMSSAKADGLRRFQQEIQPRLKKNEFAYEKASPLGTDGFVLEKVTVFSPGKPGQPELRIARLEVEDLDYSGFAAGEARFAKVAARGMMVPENGTYAPEARRLAAAMNTSDGSLDYRYDPATKVLTVNWFELVSGRDKFSAEMVLEKVPTLRDARAFDAGVSVRSARILYDNRQSLARVLRLLGAQSGKSEQVLQSEWLTRIAVTAANKGQRTVQSADAIASFLQDYRQPKGPLTLNVRPNQPVPFAMVLAALFLPDPAQVIGLTATYSGTRAGAAVAAR